MAETSRPGLDPKEEGKSFGALFVLLVALLVAVSVWSIWDDNISRRPWKEEQVEFDRLAYDKYMSDVDKEQKRLNRDADYVKLEKGLAQAEAQLHSGATARRLSQFRSELAKANVVADDRDQAVRFTKSYLTERWYDYNHAVEEKQDSAAYWKDIERLNAELQVEQGASNRAKAEVDRIKAEIENIRSKAEGLKGQLKKLTKKRDDLIDRADHWMIPVKFMGRVVLRYPRIPKIEQTAIDGFDRNPFDEAVARVDRCMSCHAGIDKKGFESAPQPFRTHSNYDQIILKHPPDKLGCTPCHEGQGPAVNSVAMAHGEVEHWDHPLLKGGEVQARCAKCHIDVGSLQDDQGAQLAASWVRGDRLFEQLGCAACHALAGYEKMPKIGPYLKLAAAKLDPSWAVRWIGAPHQFRPNTRMPDFLFSRSQAVSIAAYLFSSSAARAQKWWQQHSVPADFDSQVHNAAMAEEGKALFESVGCKACHSVEPGQVGTPVGWWKDFKPGLARTAKNFAPNLSRIAEKTDARWIFTWIKNPRGYSPNTAMPSLRLSDSEAEALTAFLMTQGKKQEDPALAGELAKAGEANTGAALIRKYGCFGCHEIEGMDKEAKVGVELTTFGSKHLDELFFGNRADIPRSWSSWVYNKLYNPRVYATKDVEQAMPNFELQDRDIRDLRVFLASLTESKVPERYRAPGTEHQTEIVNGRRLVNYYNCVGCHIVENRGGYVRRFYKGEDINFAPPILVGEGEKVQPQWLFTFIQGPASIRPWLKIRMPTFRLDELEDNTLVNYFTSLANLQVGYMFLNTDTVPASELRAGEKLMSKDYFNCFTCHQQGEKKPEGPASGWAPDLALGSKRLNPDWIIKWIKDPQKVQAGTKMPAYYPGGPDDILGGNEDAQIRAMRDYTFWFGEHPGQKLPGEVAEVRPAHEAIKR